MHQRIAPAGHAVYADLMLLGPSQRHPRVYRIDRRIIHAVKLRRRLGGLRIDLAALGYGTRLRKVPDGLAIVVQRANLPIELPCLAAETAQVDIHAIRENLFFRHGNVGRIILLRPQDNDLILHSARLFLPGKPHMLDTSSSRLAGGCTHCLARLGIARQRDDPRGILCRAHRARRR